jgi:branched-chain amino acid transport system substrate-binding protein
MGGSTTLACIPLLKQNNILSLNDAAGGKAVTNPDNPLVFRFNPAIEAAYAAALPYLQKHDGIKTVACINPDDETGRANLVASKYVMGKLKLDIIASEFYERGIKDFTSVLTRVIAKNPDLIETGMTDPTSQALVLKQARELGYKGKMYLVWGPDPIQILKIAGPLAEGAYLGAALTEPVNERQKAIYARFLKKYPARDWNSGYYTHSALFTCLTKAIEKCQSFDPVTIAKTLEDLTWEGVMGTHKWGGKKLFGIKRQMVMPVNINKVVNGKVVWLTTLTPASGIID